MSRPHLYNWYPEGFTLHSGSRSPFLMNCDALTVADWEALAAYVVHIMRIEFSMVVGVPRGGLRFAEALKPYQGKGPLLIADDVCTTGASLEEYRKKWWVGGMDINGVVLYARGPCPSWVSPIWRLEVGSDG
jgi:orotate phosphoribosyltransferase